MQAEPAPRLSVYTAVDRNRLRTVLLVVAFLIIVAALAYVGGELFAPGAGAAALPLAFMFSLGSTAASYFAGDRLILGISRAREVGEGEEPVLRNVTEALAIGAGLPTPRLHVIEDPAPNAFATGRDPAHASIAVTRGLLDALDRAELEGVIAHELAHVGNRDIRLMLFVVALAGTVALFADHLMRGLWWGGRRGRDRDRGGVIALVAFALALLTPVVASLIQMAVSREREHLADASAVLLTRYPPGLAGALRKIAADPSALSVANKATEPLYFADPLRDRPAFFDRLFATHPSIEERIRRLESM